MLLSQTRLNGFRKNSLTVSRRRLVSYIFIAATVLSFLALFLAPELHSSPSFADEPITINPSIAIGNNGSIDLNANPGQFTTNSENVTVTTTNYTGYTMTIAPTSGTNTDLAHTSATGLAIPSIQESLTSQEFSSLSSIAYGLSIDDGDNYIPVTNNTTIKTTNSATNATTGSFNLTLGAMTLPGTPSGTYSKTFVLTATANAPVYAITYNANVDGQGGSGTGEVTNLPSPNPQITGASGLNLILSATVPERDGYIFLGWSETASDTTATYQPEDTFTLNPETGNSVTLYAIWEIRTFSIIYDGNNADGGNMSSQFHQNLQDGDVVQLRSSNFNRSDYGFVGWSPDPDVDPNNPGTTPIYGPNQTILAPAYEEYGQQINNEDFVVLYAIWAQSEDYLQDYVCSLNKGEVTALTDKRDGETYAIAKLDDGNCWMIENLRLGNEVNQSTLAVYSEGTGGHFTQLPASVNDTWGSNTSNNLYGESADGNVYSRRELPQLNTNSTNRNLDNSPSSNTNNKHWWSYGHYYSWASAKASTLSLNTRATSEAQTTSICPVGWHLPSGTNGEYSDLLTSLETYVDSTNPVYANSSAVSRSFPNNFVLSGNWSDSAPAAKNSNGLYWASTVYNADNAERFVVGTTGDAAVSNNRKWNGYTVRCVADTGYRINYQANNGTNVKRTKAYKLSEQSITLDNNQFEKQFYQFVEWNTAPDGSGTAYGAGDSYAIPAEAEDGDSITLYAIWEIAPYDIRYLPNGGNGSMAGVGHSGVYEGNELLLLDSAFSRTGYGFIGWSFDPDAQLGGTSTIYGANETISAPSIETYGTAGNNVYLYAIWEPTAGSMQSFNCSSLSIGDIIALTDSRDNNDYAVSRLSDGTCWMIENLRLDLSQTAISTSDTNNPTTSFIAEANDSTSTSASSWCDDNTAACIKQVSYNTDNLTQGLDARTNFVYRDGVLYNWYTATAGNSATITSASTAAGDICPYGWQLPSDGKLNSLLTLAGDSGSTGSDTMRKLPYNFVLSGRYDYTGYTSRRSVGIIWGSDSYNANISRRFVVTPSSIGVSQNYVLDGYAVRCITSAKHTLTVEYGTGVASVTVDGNTVANHGTISLEEGISHNIDMTFSSGYAFNSWSISGTGASVGSTSTQSTTVTIGTANATLTANGKASKIYMQNLTNSQCATLASSSAITVYDRRDESDYTVRYLNNQCWMTQNLRITGTITAKDSNNVQWSNFTSPASFNVSQYDLVTDGAYGGRCSPDYSSSVCSHYYSGDTDTGGKPTAWYNYTAATAGSIITGGSNSTAASSDICPAGWRLPTNTEQSNLKTAISSNVSVFSPVYGGYCYNGSIAYPSTYALWWSATASDGTNRYSLSYNYGSLDTASLPRFVGFYVRCVRSS